MNDLTLAWHFVNGTLRDGSPIPPDGEWLHYEGECVMCERGLHASRRLVDALLYAPGTTICRVACADIVDEEEGKMVCRSRFILWRLEEQNDLLTAFARKAALSVIHLWSAPDVVQQYLETGDISTRAAARSAARDAAAARAAASAAARDAASAAARAAAWAAARDAAAAGVAAAAAAGAVAENARLAAAPSIWPSVFFETRDAFINERNTELEAMVLNARGNPDDAYLLTRVPCPRD